jgi:hypothetical protein
MAFTNMKQQQKNFFFSNDSSECPICFYDIGKKEYITKCKHSFCKKCAQSWFKNHKDCPICRQIMNKPKKNFMTLFFTIFFKCNC